MFKLPDGSLRYSPSDLVRFSDSAFASWATRFSLEHPSRAFPRDAEDEELKLLQEKGLTHEADYLQRIQGDHSRSVYVIETGDRSPDDLAAETLSAMTDGHDVIFQAYLRANGFHGYADFLFRVPGDSSLGTYHYEPWDTKLALSPRPYFVIQLCCYAELLETIQGFRPAHIGVVLGDQQEHTLRTSDFFDSYQVLKKRFLAQMQGTFEADALPPIPEMGQEHRPFNTHVAAYLAERDHLSLVAGISKRQVDALNAAGISTLGELASSSATGVHGLHSDIFRRLQEQASLQRDSRSRERPLFRIVQPDPDEPERGLARLPPPTDLDVFFDMEGFPLVPGGLEYLFGATTRDGENRSFKAFWAHNVPEEKAAFEAFIDWVTDRFHRDPSMHVYHYAPYEVTALRRLMGRHATREDEVDALLRGGVFVDLYRVVREGVRVGEPSYSIKNLEHLYQDARGGEVQSGGASIVQYHRWTTSGEPPDIHRSPLLKAIHDYNRDDCDSTLALYDWLREQARHEEIHRFESGLNTMLPTAAALPEEVVARRALRAAILDPLPDNVEAQGSRDERVRALLAELLEFHRREEKPLWWRRYDRLAQLPDDLTHDTDCLAGLVRTEEATIELGRGSVACWYVFDTPQETKLRQGSDVLLHATPDLKGTTRIEEICRRTARVRLKFTGAALAGLPDHAPPHTACLLPRETSRAGALKTALMQVISTWHETGELPAALEQFLHRSPPRLKNACSPSRLPDESASQHAVRLAPSLDRATLCIQGPPGTGKTYTGARMILAALRAGQRVGVTSNSHKAIENLLRACHDAALENGYPLRGSKVDANPRDLFFEEHPAIVPILANEVATRLDEGVSLIGATAWTFARPELEQAFDTLFIDEAGQVSLANLVSMSRSAGNLVLLGDQRQLAQPIQGSHPGESGQSVLKYLLQDHAIVPEMLGIFLDETWRMHPGICSFVSSAFYDGRLESIPKTEERAIVPNVETEVRWLTSGTGIRFLPVHHQGNSVSSPEEAEYVSAIIEHLLGCRFTEDSGLTARPVNLVDILIIAPYNAQVTRLIEALPDGARVGTVDKFQGQEAPVVILSMTTSDTEGAPRGPSFIFDPHRLNVALSRAQALALVVGSPKLASPDFSSMEQLRLSSLFCRVVQAGTQPERT